MSELSLPAGVEYVRTTRLFDEATVPAALLGRHRVADRTWAALTVHSGSVVLVFDEPALGLHASLGDGTGRPEHSVTQVGRRIIVSAGHTQIIPPRRLHHLELIGPVTFDIAFHRPIEP